MLSNHPEHLNIQVYEPAKLPEQVSTHPLCEFGRDRRIITLFVWCSCIFHDVHFLFRDNSPEWFCFCLIDKCMMKQVFQPVTGQADFSGSVIQIATRIGVLLKIRNNRVNGHRHSGTFEKISSG